jgi:hypothetical protein
MVKRYRFFSLLFLVVSMQQVLQAQWSHADMSIGAKKTELVRRADVVSMPQNIFASIEVATSHITLDALEKLVTCAEKDLHQLHHQWDNNFDNKEVKDVKYVAQVGQVEVIQSLQEKFKKAAFCLLAGGLPVWLITSYFMMSMGLRASEDIHQMLETQLLDICLGTCKLTDLSAAALNSGSNYRACLALPAVSRMKMCGRFVGSFIPYLVVGYIGYRLYKSYFGSSV